MSSKTKIVVLRMKEIIYTAIFIGLALFLAVLGLIMLRSGSKDNTAAASALYVPGVYSSSLALGSETVGVEVTVDSDRVTGVSLVPLSEAVATMYPLMQPTLDELASQIVDTQSTANLTYPQTSRYTSELLIGAVEKALAKAQVSP